MIDLTRKGRRDISKLKTLPVRRRREMVSIVDDVKSLA